MPRGSAECALILAFCIAFGVPPDIRKHTIKRRAPRSKWSASYVDTVLLQVCSNFKWVLNLTLNIRADFQDDQDARVIRLLIPPTGKAPEIARVFFLAEPAIIDGYPLVIKQYQTMSMENPAIIIDVH